MKIDFKYLLLLLLLLFGFIKTYSLHYDYRFPYHQDEWQHLAIAMQAASLGYNAQYNPYIGIPTVHADLESGFHLYLASIQLMTHLDLILVYKFFAASFAVLSALSIFIFMQRTVKNFTASLVSVIVFFSLKSNVNILGNDYFVPLTMAIPFLFLFLLYFTEALKEKSAGKLGFSFLLLIVLFLIHPPSCTILAIPVLAEVLLNIRFFTREIGRLQLILLSLAIAAVAVPLVWKGSMELTLIYLRQLLVFEKGWGKLEIIYFIPLLYGLVSTGFAIYGFIRHYNSGIRLFTFFLLSSLGITAFFNIFGFTIIVPYSRALHYSMLALIPFTSVGVASAMESFHIKEGWARGSIIAVFMLLVMISQYGLDNTYKRYRDPVITEKDYQALLWMKQNLGEDNILVTPYFMTSSVYPVSGNRVISIVPAQFEGGMMQENLNFFTLSCTAQEQIIDDSGAGYILSRTPMQCNHTLIYQGSDYIYKTA